MKKNRSKKTGNDNKNDMKMTKKKMTVGFGVFNPSSPISTFPLYTGEEDLQVLLVR